MPTITAILHTKNDALRLGRCLETLYPCDAIVVIDHGSSDGTARLARQYGARLVEGRDSANQAWAELVAEFAPAEWMLCLEPNESLSESLAASLFEWKLEPVRGRAFSVVVREETKRGWVENDCPETRLVPGDWKRWEGRFPGRCELGCVLEGALLRFAFPESPGNREAAGHTLL